MYQYVVLQMVSVLIGVIYYGQELNQDGVVNINGAFFIFLTNMTFQNMFAVVNVSRPITITCRWVGAF
jgi:hypothetical protein